MREKILSHDRAVPRYTSYPTAPHFKDLEAPGLYEEWLGSISADDRLSVYLHVPFCQKMCWYCGCHTKITQRYAPVEDYAHLMMREIDMLGDRVTKSAPVSHIHFGGGSPGLLQANDFTHVMSRLRQAFTFSDQAEIAIEIDPRGVTSERIEAYARSGVNRVSLGVQDFDQKVLDAVNRPQPFSLSYDAVKMFRQNGVEKISIDLLYGLPHQTAEIMAQTIDKALLLDPDRVSLFGYAHVPWMKKHMRLIDETVLPDKSLRFDLFETGAHLLEAAGYVAIGIDHFAKRDDPMVVAVNQGKLHRNFQGYTTDTANVLLGIGASAIGKMPQGYIQNAVDLPAYKERVLDGRLSAKKYCLMSDEDRLRADIIERLMCDFMVDLESVCRTYDTSIKHFSKEMVQLKSYEADGFVAIDEERGFLTISKEARPMARLICSVFDVYLPEVMATPRHAQAV